MLLFKKRSLSRILLVFASSFSCISCSSPLAIELYYDDPLIEAPARTVNLHLLQDISCEAVMSRPHGEGVNTPEFIKQYNYSYPVLNKAIEVEDLEGEEKISVAVEVYNRQLTSVARGCLSGSVQDLEILRIQLFVLPRCETPPAAIDLSLVIDTSASSFAVDDQLLHLEALKKVFVKEEIFSRWTIIKTGGTPKLMTVGNSSAIEVEAVIDDLRVQYTEPTNQLFDGIALAAKTVRAKALCGRVPTIFVYTAGPDNGSVLNLQNATLGVGGSSMDSEDNIYTVGFALEQQGFSEMINIIPENSGSYILGTQPELLEQQFFEAREQLQALIP